MSSLSIVILAAGLGKRMKSGLPKVLSRVRGRSLIDYVLETALSLNPERVVVVTGHKRELVEQEVRLKYPSECGGKIIFSVQLEQKGTGDAVRSAMPSLEGVSGPVLILCGDTPLISKKTIGSLAREHDEHKATLSLLILKSDSPNAYGRVVRDQSGNFVSKIVESRDCGPAEAGIREFNSGVYIVDSAFLWPAVSELKNDNAQGEFYLTDIVGRAAKEGQTVWGAVTEDEDEIQGVNTPVELQRIKRVLNMKKIMSLIEAGVEVEDVSTLYIDDSVEVSPGAKIGPNVQLRGATKIGPNVVIEGTAFISNSEIMIDAQLKLGVRIEDSIVGPRSKVGPFAHLRPGSVLKEDVKIGNFVETKKAVLENGAQASHLTYLGDAHIGEKTNIGAGTITCNYDGTNKWPTKIGKEVFIGSNSALVAPLVINDGATIGAGSVITKDVEAGALAITRSQQITRAGYARGKKKK